MTRRTSWTQAYAIVRRDHFPSDAYDPDESSPPSMCGGEYSYTVKEVVLDEAMAINEVERLNALAQGKATRYFCQGTRVFTDGGSFGGEPESHGRG